MKIRLWRPAREPEVIGIHGGERPTARLWSNALTREKRAQRWLTTCQVRLADIAARRAQLLSFQDRIREWSKQVAGWQAAGGEIPPAGLAEIVAGLSSGPVAAVGELAAIRFSAVASVTSGEGVASGREAVRELVPTEASQELFYEVGLAMSEAGLAKESQEVFRRMATTGLGGFRDTAKKAAG